MQVLGVLTGAEIGEHPRSEPVEPRPLVYSDPRAAAQKAATASGWWQSKVKDFTKEVMGWTSGAATVRWVRYYVHGAGRSGRAAWPAQDEAQGLFADHGSVARMVDKAALVAAGCPDDVGVVVSHSLGAVAAALAHQAGSLPAVPHVLVEPALYDVARGEAAIEAHVGPMDDARARAADGDLLGFWQVFAPMMMGRDATADTWAEDRPVAERFAAMEPPWGHGLAATVLADVPTLVVTGGWNEEYEVIASRLVTSGARHVVLPGAGHRPQDLPGFEDAVTDFLATAH